MRCHRTRPTLSLSSNNCKEAVTKPSKLDQKRVCQRVVIDINVLYDNPKLYRWVQDFIKEINALSTEFNPLILASQLVEKVSQLNLGVYGL